jgi:alpha-glucosidase
VSLEDYTVRIRLNPPSFQVSKGNLVLIRSKPNWIKATDSLPHILQSKEGGIYDSMDDCYSHLWDLQPSKVGNCYSKSRLSITNLQSNQTSVTLTGKINHFNYTFTISLSGQLKFHFKSDSKRIRMDFEYLDNEKIYGFGEQTSVKRGTLFPLMTSEQGVGRGAQPLSDIINKKMGFTASGTEFTTYAPMPVYVTSKNRFFVLDNNGYQIWDLTDGIAFDITTSESYVELCGYFGRENSILEAIEQNTIHTGKFKMLPDWIHQGSVIGYTGGTDKILSTLKTLLKRNVPITAVWFQDWSGLRNDTFGSRLWWNWELDQDHYHSWTNFTEQLKQMNIKPMIYINPYLSDSVDKKPNAVRNLYKEAVDGDYLVKNHTGLPYILTSASKTFSYATIDLTNPEAIVFYKEIIKCNLLRVCDCNDCEPQVYGWMTDFGESLPLDSKLNNTQGYFSDHNLYPIKWQTLVSQVLQEYDQVVSFTRSGWTRTPSLTNLHWVGDQTVTWDEKDGLASALRSTLSCGLSGLSLVHSDIGGYTAPKLDSIPPIMRNLELFLRWAEYSAFADTIFRTHIGTNPLQLQVDSTIEASYGFAKAAKWHQKLFPYRKYLMKLATEKGWPIARHMILEFSSDENVYELYDQFMMGHCLLIAPVLQPNTITVQLYLPVGKWTHLWTDTILESTGESVFFDAPIGQPAVFVRSNISNDIHRSFDCNSIKQLL